jgi:NAD(P)-dependent dehydrogenase (short-subunit alcohol dehydrogenase family)
MSLSKNFDNKVVLVTGSSSGIGAATAILFSELGAKVVVHGRNEKKISEIAKKCNAVSPKSFEVSNTTIIISFFSQVFNILNPKIFYNLKPLEVIADVGKEEDVNKLMDAVIEHYNQLDIVVNNAGRGGGSDHESLEEFDEFIETDLRSIYHICLRALPLLEKSKGVIINNSSVCSLKPVRDCS